jgi:hypothetical protein
MTRKPSEPAAKPNDVIVPMTRPRRRSGVRVCIA